MTEPLHVSIENAEVARLLRETGDLLELAGANPFRVRAYRNAARTVEELPRPVAEIAAGGIELLDELPGIGADLATTITTIVETGAFPLLDELRRDSPGAAELLHVPGIGPKRARALADRLHVHTLAELEREARAHHIAGLRGFGELTERRILAELDAHREVEHRMSRARAAQYAESLERYLLAEPGVERLEVAGSFRRGRETVGDLDIVATAPHAAMVIGRFVAYPSAVDVIARGPTRASIRLRCGLGVDLRVVPPASFGAALHYLTGSKAHNIAIRRRGRAMGLKINEYGVHRDGRRIGGADERDVFEAVGLSYIVPELREDRGEIEAAEKGTLPLLLELAQIRGDLHTHTRDSDGRATLAEMAHAAEEMGYEYIAITDHTPAVRIAGGLDRAGFLAQMRRIDRLNASLRSLTILKGAEVDILEDGALDLDDATLGALDVVIAALHSKLGLARERQTTRLLRAMEHPAIDILGHPTGRMIGRRRGATFDTERVISAAIERGIVFEINAQPERLDLPDTLARAVVDAGGTIAVGTDAHSVDELRLMRWGVDNARRGWITAAMTLNALPLDSLTRRLHGARRGRS